MPRTPKAKKAPATIGERLRELRSAKGYSQRELARAAGTSQRMVAHYETRGRTIPGHLLVAFARVLGVDPDDILGNRPLAPAPAESNTRLWRKLRLVSTFPPRDRRHVLQVIDMIVERNTLRRERQAT